MFAIKPFSPEDQAAVRALVLAGLGEHFADVDPSRNPDLNDITTAYLATGAHVLVAEHEGRLVGCGALVWESAETGRLVRLSVAADHRRKGLAAAIVTRLWRIAESRGARRLVVETNEDWHAAIRLYEKLGFAVVKRLDGELHFVRELP